MDNATLVTIMWTAMGAVSTAFLGLLCWGVKKLIVTTFENTMQIKILNANIAQLMGLPPKVEKLQKDINEAHTRIRMGFKHQTQGGNL